MPEYRKKLIEVALPLEAINKESAREKSIRHGHPSTLHLWWARRPLAACRAVLFAQMVDDPSSLIDEFPTEEAQETERQRLFRIIEELVKWDNTTNEVVLHAGRVEIARSAARNHDVFLPHSMTPAEVAGALEQYAPPVMDPFAGGGSIPLEAQRLGLEAHASDLNPVAVLINKALIEIPPKFAGYPSVNPESHKTLLQREWKGARGLADDIRYYGNWMRNEAWKRIGHLYPKVHLSKEYGSGQATVIAWLWTRTVTCPNPACCAQMPLVRSFWLSTKKGNEAWVEPRVDNTVVPPAFHFTVRTGNGKPLAGTVNRQGAICIACGTPVPFEYIRSEGKARRMNVQLMAIVAEGQRGRVYLSPLERQVTVAAEAKPEWIPDMPLPYNPRNFNTPIYGLDTFDKLFTPRQLLTLTTYSTLLREAKALALADAIKAGLSASDVPLREGGKGALAYADAVSIYLAFAIDKTTTTNTSTCAWQTEPTRLVQAFGRQTIPMIWDYAEANPFSHAAGDYNLAISSLTEVIDRLLPGSIAAVQQKDAAVYKFSNHYLISTDPPYYDNIIYSDLSDFFYVWLRHSLNDIFPDLFETLLVPKAQELVATPYRFSGDKSEARQFFEEGLSKVFANLHKNQDTHYPLTLYYAFKQSELDEVDGSDDHNVVIASTGWETMLEGLIRAGFTITGTWPMRTELIGNLKKKMGALASSIVLVCRPRHVNASIASRRDFLNALKRELPKALKDLQRGNIAPVDLAQASIGPGMAVFSRYNKVLESDGAPVHVRTALQLINQLLDEVLAEQEMEYDSETRWAVAWFEQYGMEEGPYGVAETLSKAKNTAVGALVEAGILRAQGGKVRLLHRGEFSSEWNPATAKRLTVWEVTQRLIRALQENGDAGAASILDHVGAYGEVARHLAYRLFTVCERKKWADEALAYNSLVVEWSDISGAAERLGRTTAEQARLFS